ncbi:hemolymph lipopolysaccharide-binding protein-like [Hylaeus volcanicus]|uniref:hemolymph lipopolysaccharide-binding protein-like n=1 Tax=Hylaeus volcanicus TaxID=313075 RepID=UPI0023B77C4D|nr:hemolymph lipopolysaccharide-binding protein-like [Hylaeus volcanicus]
MYKQLLALLALTSGIFCAVMPRTDTAKAQIFGQNQSSIVNGTLHFLTGLPSNKNDSNQPVVNMSGENNYHATQQIFYVTWSPNGSKRNCTTFVPRDDYVLNEGIGAYKLHARRIRWNDAREACMDEGGHLAIVNSLAEESVLLKFMVSANVDHAWVGVHDLFSEGAWVTLTGESLEKAGFDKWTTMWPNEPDNFGGHQNCGVLMQSGGLDDVDCVLHHGFICEIDIC